NSTGLVPIRADEARSTLWSRPISLNFGRRRGPSLVQLAMFTRELAMLLDAGEASGNLPAVLNNLTDYLESMARLRESLTSALIYPALVAVTCLGSLA